MALKKRTGRVAFLDYDGVPGKAKKVEGIVRELVTLRLYNFNMPLGEYKERAITKGQRVNFTVSGGEAALLLP